MSREPKKMWSARLPGGLVDQVVEVAEEEGVSQATLVEQIFGEWLDARAVSRVRDLRALSTDGVCEAEEAVVGDVERAAREALPELAERLECNACHGCYIEQLVLCVKCSAQDGVVVGLTGDPLSLLTDLTEFATIVAGAAGRSFRVEVDG
jgi:hypothetical protein